MTAMQTRIEKRQFRFKRDYFQIKDSYNIPGLIICSGFGYDLLTYCCKACGEVFVIDRQLYDRMGDLTEITNHKNCPVCTISLDNNIVKYPENVFYKGAIHVVISNIDNSHFDETELVEVYEIKK